MRKIKYVFLVLFAFWLCGCGSPEVTYVKGPVEETVTFDDENFYSEEVELSGTESDVNESVTVYVCGAVKAEGVFTLPQSSRISDAVALAGGFKKKADKTCVNLADFLYDGEMIVITDKKKVSAAERDNVSANESGTSKVNINSASKEVLMTISGIGEAKADSIISFREESGGFSSEEDIMLVPGIAEGIYVKIKDYITV